MELTFLLLGATVKARFSSRVGRVVGYSTWQNRPYLKVRYPDSANTFYYLANQVEVVQEEA